MPTLSTVLRWWITLNSECCWVRPARAWLPAMQVRWSNNGLISLGLAPLATSLAIAQHLDQSPVLNGLGLNHDCSTQGNSIQRYCTEVDQRLDRFFELWEQGGPWTWTPSHRLQGSQFQLAVWRAAQNIPAGHTQSYGDLARSIGAPGAARAVGSALGANPLLLIVPCHRVVRQNGSLGGFAAGLGLKSELLNRER